MPRGLPFAAFGTCTRVGSRPQRERHQRPPPPNGGGDCMRAQKQVPTCPPHKWGGTLLHELTQHRRTVAHPGPSPFTGRTGGDLSRQTGPATPRPAQRLHRAIDNQSQLVANHSHDRLCLPRPEYLQGERRHCGGRALPCAGPPPPRNDDKLRKMLRNCLRDDPRAGRAVRPRRYAPADRGRVGPIVSLRTQRLCILRKIQ